VQTETLLDNAVSDHLRNSVQRFQHAVDEALKDWSSYQDQVHAYGSIALVFRSAD